jgi:hypothetical protein
MTKIVALQLKSLRKLMEEQEMGFDWTENAVKEVTRVGFDPIFGARPLKRAIQKLIENPISTLIIEQKAKMGDKIIVDFNGEDFVFNIEAVEMVAINDMPQTSQQFTCNTCGNIFETIVVSNATPICTKCASHAVVHKTDEKPAEVMPQQPPTDTQPAVGQMLGAQA